MAKRITNRKSERSRRGTKKPVLHARPDSHPVPHLNPEYPVQRMIVGSGRTLIDTVSVQLEDGQWLATKIDEGTAATAATKSDAEKAVRKKVLARIRSEKDLADHPRKNGSPMIYSPFDFYATHSAAELAQNQGVKSITTTARIRPFSNPDPREAEWLARQVRLWRRQDH